MIQTKKNIFEKTYTIIIYINIILLNIFVGSTHENPRIILETTIIIEALIYIITSKICKKEKILIKGKIDIAITAMMLITAIPLIAKTYCSLSDTIDIFIQYTTIYSMYIMVRNLITTSKRKKTFVIITLLSSIPIVLFGIDRMNFNLFQKFYDITKSAQVEDVRMTSTIGYSNAVFAYIGALIIIALGKFLENDNKKTTGLYAIYIQIGMYALYYCNSRAGMVIYAILFIAYLVHLKDANKILPSIFIMIFTYVLVVVFDKVKIEYCTQLSIFLGILITIILTYIFSYLLLEISEKIKFKNSKKRTVSILAILIITGILYVIIAQNFSKPLELKPEYDYATLYKLKPETTYTVKIDYDFEYDEPITIKVLQVDNKRNEDVIYEEEINKKGKNIIQEFTMHTGDVDYAMVEFYTSADSRATINKIFLNGKEDIVNYKFLPNDVMRLIKTFKMGNISISERISMYKSGLKLFAMHPVFGNGAKTYANMFIKVREYAYLTMEVHSYYLDILMDYGIIGIIACLSIIIITIYNFIKRKEKTNILNSSIFFAWLFIAIHTIVDFDLSYLVTITNFYMLIALINDEDRAIEKNTKWLEVSISIIMTIIIILNITRIPGEMLYNKGKYKEAMKFIPYSKNNTYQYLKGVYLEDEYLDENDMKILVNYLNNEKNKLQFVQIEMLYNKSINMIENNDIENGIKGLQQLADMIKNDEILKKHDIVSKGEWEFFVYRLKLKINDLSETYDNEKLEIIKNEIQEYAN